MKSFSTRRTGSLIRKYDNDQRIEALTRMRLLLDTTAIIKTIDGQQV
jgi:hypothetical protein